MHLMPFLKDNFQNETVTWSVDIKATKNISFNNVGQETNGSKGRVDITTQWQRISHTFTNRYTNFYAFVCYGMIGTCSPGDKIYIKLPKLEKGNVATDWTPAPEDDQQIINDLNSWKQTTTGTLNTVTNTLNDTVRHSQLQITADSINFGSNKVFNGQNLASMLSVSPDSIKAITDKLVITPANENLVKLEYRRNSSFRYDIQISEKFDIGKTKDFLIKGKARTNSYENRFRFVIKIIYKDETNDYITGIDNNKYINGGEFSIPFKITERNKEIKNAYFTIDRFGTPIFDELSIVPQKSAELIVDGTIEGKHIKSSTIETGHLKAGSVTADIIASNAVKAKHLLIDDAMINDLVTKQAFITKLWAQQAFINKLKTIKVTATSIDTEQLRGKEINGVTIKGGTIEGGEIIGETKIKLGKYGFMQPTTGGGLQINSPRLYNSIDGVGVQIIGATDRKPNVPYGVFIYKDSDFTIGNIATDTDSYLLTVNGYINAKGIMNLRVQDSYWWVTNPKSGRKEHTLGGVSIGYYNHSNINLLFGTHGVRKSDYETVWSAKDIYYHYQPSSGEVEYISLYYPLKAASSDLRLKTNVKDTEYRGLDFVSKLNFKSFEWIKGKELYHKKPTKIGLIAQDVEEIDDSLVYKNGNYLSLDEFRLLNIALKAIQELSTENKELKQRIIKLEEKING